MSNLFLVEIVPTASQRDALALLTDLDSRARAHDAQLIEAQVTADQSRLFAIIEADTTDTVAALLEGLDAEVAADPALVRLVGAELDDIKAARPEAGYLVEWDIPSHIDMDTYLTRKAEKTPLYANVPEVDFLRTYVREDMAKCLCFYNGPDEAAVERARAAVSTPIDRLHQLAQIQLAEEPA
ncbi:DUF4242 domain-containing protein [Propionibacteriaceae bacterium Y1923]|uniref:DUF4242 domain-containing protein n=1 Tax=Aestuariimicrobium sp. Y1814 TaxID=3418742 RepID=UPI003C254824